jgi:hypothetical protein
MIDAVLDILAAIGEAFASWRFYLCVVVGAAAVDGILWWLADSPWRAAAVAGASVIALVAGIVWEGRAT